MGSASGLLEPGRYYLSFDSHVEGLGAGRGIGDGNFALRLDKVSQHVPDGGSTALLLGFAGIGMLIMRIQTRFFLPRRLNDKRSSSSLDLTPFLGFQWSSP